MIRYMTYAVHDRPICYLELIQYTITRSVIKLEKFLKDFIMQLYIISFTNFKLKRLQMITLAYFAPPPPI